MNTDQKILAGINYLRMMKQGMTTFDIADDLKVEVDDIKECIALARKNKDEADRKVKAALVQPELEVWDEYHTGRMQVVKGVEIELCKPIIIKYANEKVTEFQTLMPVRIKITRP